MNSNNIYDSEGHPYIYLRVMGRWYCYDPMSEPLGNGSMGTVYMGYDVQTATPMAVKRVNDQYSGNQSVRARAKQEASLAFRHQNLIEMIGYCEMAPDQGPLFLISKFVSGINIDKYISEATFNSEKERIDFICNAICQVLEALEYIHSRGVVHRDIKPSNIMVEDNGNVRLMDLGIARMNEGNKFSKYGFIGTPQYSAPEQILREKTSLVQINATTDFYALGVTLYELIAENNPFDDAQTVNILTNQIRKDLPYDKRVPKELMKVIWKATQKEQSRRYENAVDFRTAIQAAFTKRRSFWKRLFGIS